MYYLAKIQCLIIIKFSLGVRLVFVIYRPLGYERVYLPLCKVADTPFHIQGGDIYYISTLHPPSYLIYLFTHLKVNCYHIIIIKSMYKFLSHFTKYIISSINLNNINNLFILVRFINDSNFTDEGEHLWRLFLLFFLSKWDQLKIYWNSSPMSFFTNHVLVMEGLSADWLIASVRGVSLITFN